MPRPLLSGAWRRTGEIHVSLHLRALVSLVAAAGLVATPLTAQASSGVSASGNARHAVSAVQQSASEPAKVGWNAPSMNAWGELRVVGQITKSDGTYLPKGSKVYLQHSSTGTSGWKIVEAVTTSYSGWYQIQDEDGSHAIPLDQPTGSFRLQFYGAKGALPATSKVFKSPRRPTRIIGFNASPEPVKKGGTITVTGTVQRGGTAWTSIGNYQPVTVFFIADKGNGEPVAIGTTRTNAKGTFTLKTKAKSDGVWVGAWFTSSQWYLNVISKPDAVDVR